MIGLLLTAVFFLRLIRKVFHGPLTDKTEKWTDLTASERWLFAPVIALIVIPGVWPQVILHCVNDDILRMLQLIFPAAL